MILYFTGTGNSKYAAKALAERLEDECISLNEVIKYDKDKHFQSKKPFVIVSPIYAWRLPRIVEQTLRTAVFMGRKQIYFVPTMGENSGKADKYCKVLCEAIHMEFMGFRGICFPDNYVSASAMPTEDKVLHILNEAITQIDAIAAEIKESKMIQKTDKTPLAGLMSSCVNSLFYRFATSDKNYIVSDACISCGLCEKGCSVNNIKMENGKPVFQGNCIACYSCIQHCPKEAINIKGKTEKHGRYVCPEYK